MKEFGLTDMILISILLVVIVIIKALMASGYL
jgi:hypothetical protein